MSPVAPRLCQTRDADQNIAGIILIVGQAFLPAGKRERLPYKIRNARRCVQTLGRRLRHRESRIALTIQRFNDQRFIAPRKACSLLPAFPCCRYQAIGR